MVIMFRRKVQLNGSSSLGVNFPPEVCDFLKIKKGDTVHIFPGAEGQVVIQKGDDDGCTDTTNE